MVLAVDFPRHPALDVAVDLQREAKRPTDENHDGRHQQEQGSKTLRRVQVGVAGPSPDPGKQAGPARRTVAVSMRFRVCVSGR